MENKLGIEEQRLSIIERKLINFKLNLLDQSFSFNCIKFDIDYLNSLSIFLFGDIYSNDELKMRFNDGKEKSIINEQLNNINNELLKENINANYIVECVIYIWKLQPYIIGNTRIMVAFLKILNEIYNLSLNVCINEEIQSSLEIFNKIKTVNLKRLTRMK